MSDEAPWNINPGDDKSTPKHSYSNRKEAEPASTPLERPRDRLRELQWILITVGILTVGVNIVDLLTMESQFEEARQNGARIPEELVRLAKPIDVAAIVVGVTFVVLGSVVFKSPLICAITGMLLYLTSTLLFTMLITDLFTPGLIVKIVIVVALAKGIESAAAVESEAKHKSPRSKSIGLVIAGSTFLMFATVLAALILQGEPNKPNPEGSSDSIESLISDINGSEKSKVVNAATRLTNMKPEDYPEHRRAVVVALSGKLDKQGQDECASALGVWVVPEEFQILIDALKHDSPGVRVATMRGLGRLKIPATADALADLLIVRGNNHVRILVAREDAAAAKAALIDFGPTAEPAVARLLMDPNTTFDALEILAKIGTAASLPVIDKLAVDLNYKDLQLWGKAVDAAKAIRQRKA